MWSTIWRNLLIAASHSKLTIGSLARLLELAPAIKQERLEDFFQDASWFREDSHSDGSCAYLYTNERCNRAGSLWSFQQCVPPVGHKGERWALLRLSQVLQLCISWWLQRYTTDARHEASSSAGGTLPYLQAVHMDTACLSVWLKQPTGESREVRKRHTSASHHWGTGGPIRGELRTHTRTPTVGQWRWSSMGSNHMYSAHVTHARRIGNGDVEQCSCIFLCRTLPSVGLRTHICFPRVPWFGHPCWLPALPDTFDGFWRDSVTLWLKPLSVQGSGSGIPQTWLVHERLQVGNGFAVGWPLGLQFSCYFQTQF